MDIMELGAIGELVGGVAVIATLVYLAVQLQQTKEMMRAESARSTAKDYSAFMYELIEPGRMELFRRGFDDFESMDPNDQARVHALLNTGVLASQASFIQVGRGAAEETMVAAYGDQFWAATIRSGGYAAWWDKAKRFFNPDFARHIDTLAAEQRETPFVPELLPWYRWTDPGSKIKGLETPAEGG